MLKKYKDFKDADEKRVNDARKQAEREKTLKEMNDKVKKKK